MTNSVMVAVLWAAAVYRIVLSIRSEKTIWRTAFTSCVVGVAVAATTMVYGDQTIDAWSGVWNLSLLLTRLALTAAAVACSVYIVTLKHEVVPTRAVRTRLTAAATLATVEIVAWAAAPIHAHEIATTGEVNQSSMGGCVFAVAFYFSLSLATAENAHFCLTRASSRADLTRTISLTITGLACVAGAVLFAFAAIGVLARQLVGVETIAISAIGNAGLPLVAVVLALGTLSLLIAPPVLETAQNYRRWRSVRPLWLDLIRLRPEVHLHMPVTGGPRKVLHIRLQRAMVEIRDALRVTPVSVPPAAGMRDLANALRHRTGGPRMAAEVLGETSTTVDDEQLLALARYYSRSRP